MPNRRALGTAARCVLVAGAALAAAASANQQPQPYGPQYSRQGSQYQPPASEPMPPDLATGLFDSSFGAVKIERDPQGESPEDIVGVWVYDRDGQEVVGLFEGHLDGNVLEFIWEEPADPQPLRGGGFLVFHRDGSGFYGKWWTEDNVRSGDWTGDKHGAQRPPDDGYGPPPYDDGYGDDGYQDGPAEQAPPDEDPYYGSEPTDI